MKVIFSGGYTLGPVTPLLAIHEVIAANYPEAEFLWLGTKNGPEGKLVAEAGIKFLTLPAGKFRRYLSFWNLADIFRIIVGLFKALKIMWQENPDLCVSAGGFVSVPVHWAAWLFGVPTWIHQQDVQVGLANKLMAPFATLITTALENNVKSFGHSASSWWRAKSSHKFKTKKTVWLGNPVRQEILAGNKKEAVKQFNLKPDLPVVFATGGGTGSLRVNQLIIQSLPNLKTHCQVIHLSGRERPQELVVRAEELFSDFYQVHQFFTGEMKEAYAVADVVVSRGGIGTIAEIAALEKPAILIPKPGHQEENVKFLAAAGAVILVDEKTADGNFLAKTIRELLLDSIKQKQLGTQLAKMMPRADSQKILEIVQQLTINRGVLTKS